MNNLRTTIVTSAFIKNNDDKFLFVKRSDDDSFLPGYWEMPGGKTEFGEDLKDAVSREIKEEVGLVIDPSYIIATRNYLHESNQNQQYLELFYLGTITASSQQVTLSFEHSQYKWVSFEEAKNMHTTPYIIEVLDEIARHPFLNNGA